MRGNIFNYLKRNGNYDFNEKPFNEIDNLILAELVYLPLKNIVPSFNEGYITIKEADILLRKKYTIKDLKKISFLLRESAFLLRRLATCKRFQDALLYNYVKLVDDDKQFGAVTIELNDKSIYVSYEGTDTSIVGWEEDLKMSYKFPVSSQKLASMYLNSTIHFFDRNIRVGGHSKGGNLAMAASMNCNFFIRKRIINIYNNDGPGFLKKEIESRRYQKIASKITTIVPGRSIIGMFLFNVSDCKVVKSTNKGILQHDAFNWICDDNAFITTNLSKNSILTKEKLSKWLDNVLPEEREACVSELFKIFKDNNIKDTTEINLGGLFRVIRGFRNISSKEKEHLVEAFKIIAFGK